MAEVANSSSPYSRSVSTYVPFCPHHESAITPSKSNMTSFSDSIFSLSCCPATDVAPPGGEYSGSLGPRPPGGPAAGPVRTKAPPSGGAFVGHSRDGPVAQTISWYLYEIFTLVR